MKLIFAVIRDKDANGAIDGLAQAHIGVTKLASTGGFLRDGNTTLMIHQTWAYAENSTHKRFADYGKDQMKMYKDVVDCVSRVARLNGIDLVIPCGTAIQNGRTSSLGDTFCRDGFHLQRTYGRYTAACTWFEKIFNRDVVENPYFPDTISEKEKRIARYAAHYAVKAPEVITDMKAF